MRKAFPFSAIVGQTEMKQALLMAAVEPRLGGVMVFGDRGTGKSTAVRALAALLPPMMIVPGCRYSCAPVDSAPCIEGCRERAGKAVQQVPVPFVDLPLGATEDRVVGSLDLERARATGEKRFEPGLLAKANRGFLYIDEINLLEDHLVDLLLDVAVSGQNVVEREGLSIRHPARFILVGSGNPEEGELRPPLLDRFGLSVDVRTPTDIGDRIEIVKRCDAFDREPDAFCARFEDAEHKVVDQIAAARKRLPKVEVPDSILELGTRLCQAVGADGLRGELTLLRAARATAALAGKKLVAPHHLASVATLALRHRMRKNVLDDTGSTARIERAVAELVAA
ncbi:Mg-protoporphyrin IX chelatase [Polymorphobacter multimanifer]|uniref:magnesium chelatase ATPase subunit I n=1 Tax=Polymorphobacter multimanifer TaxID=1070431 RepID=UPI00166686E1|nr:magnesium chelatase ATPase subunit I [Polymorphobacter multimanifer]GGI81784.1 Mg-protoporphyrin IX chelatase [Polymorphobacter multimanifer]